MIRARLTVPVLALAWLVPAIGRAQTKPTLDVDLGGGVTLALVLVPAGSFVEGSPPGEAGRSEDERAHPVTLGNDVYIGKYPVTRGQFARFVSASGYTTAAEKGTSGGSGWDGTALVQRRDFTWKAPGFAQTDEHPVTLVTYDDALAFTGWLSKTSGRAFTLPTEAQWEHAYRAGTTGAYYGATNATEALDLGWFKPNAGNGTHPVGQKKANALGLFDLGGNVNEWCLDWYAPYGVEAAVDPVATTPDASDKPRRVLRGGSWLKDAKSGRAAARYRNTPGSRNADNGFRVAAGTTTVAALMAPTPAPASPPPVPARTPPTLSPATGSGVGPLTFLLLAIFGGAFVMIVWTLVKSRRSRGNDSGPPAIEPPQGSALGHRLGQDGFWLEAPGHLVGSTVSYRYALADGTTHDGQTRVEGAPGGQYVYTGHQPSTMLALQLADAVFSQSSYAGSRGVSVSPSRHSRGVSVSSSSYTDSYGVSDSSSHHFSSGASSNSDPEPFQGFPSAY